jgi:TonB family protein
MNSTVPYLVQSTATLLVLYAVYWFFLRKDTFFHINRFYLVLTLLLSLVMPLFDIRLFSDGPVSPVAILLDTVTITPEKIEKVTSGHLSWFETAGVIYLTGVIIFMILFIIRLIQLALIIHRHKITRQEGMNLVFVDKGYSPFSFFNLVFIRKDYNVNGKLTPVLAHEEVHIRQYHTIDLLLAEIVIIIQWFNPIAWFMGRSIKNNHEFLADEGVLKKGFLKQDYQTLILNEAMGLQINNLTNNFNVSLIKNRIQMMTKARSRTWAVSKVLITVPAIFFLMVLFAAGTTGVAFAQEKKEEPKSLGHSKGIGPQQTKEEQEKAAQEEALKSSQASSQDEKVYDKVEQLPSYPGGDQARIDFLIKNIRYPEEAKKKGVQGKVFVSFVVEKDGSLSDIKVLRGIGSGCDEEAVRVIKMMPKWEPGMNKGKPVKVQFVLPIKFALGEKPDTEKDKAKDQVKDQK